MRKTSESARLKAELKAAREQVDNLQRELTAVKREQGTQKVTEQMFFQLLQVLPVGVSILDGDNNVIFSNQILEQILDISHEDLESGIHKNRRYLAADGSAMPASEFAYARAAASGKAVYNVETGIVRDGKPDIWTSVSAIPVEFPGWKTIILTTDITRQKEGVLELRSSEERFRSMFERHSAIMLIIDPDSGEVLDANPAAQNFYGYPLDVFKSLKVYDINTKPPEQIRAKLQAASQHPQVCTDLLHRIANGDMRLVEIHSTQITMQGKPVLFAIIHDISERKKFEDERDRLLERLQIAAHAAHIGIWDWNIQKNELFWDEGMYTLYGLSSDQFGGAYQSWLNGVHPDDRETTDATTIAAVRGELVYNTEFRVLWPDGSVHWLKADGDVIRNREGTPERMIGMNFDITERKNLEERLRESEQKYTLLFQKMSIPVFLIKLPEVQIVDANEASEKLTGFTRAEMLGKNAAELGLISKQQRAKTISEFERDQALIENEMRIITKAGEERIIVIDTNPLMIGGNSYAITSMQDITGRKQAEIALLESRENLAHTFDRNPAAMVLTRQSDGKFVRINAAHSRLIGYQPEELIGRTADEMKIYANPEQHQEILNLLVKDGNVRDYEVFIRIKSGEIRTLVASMEPLRFDGEDCLLSSLLDITERRKAEDELRRSNAELAQFAYVASHDLQEPLRTVAGMVELLEQRYADELDDRALEYIHFAVDASVRMQTLINDLLNYSRVGRIVKPFMQIGMDQVLNTAIANLKAAITESNALITHDPMPTMYVDPALMAQVFQNLLGNAIKFRANHPLHIHIGAEKADSGWQFSVADNGVGIEPQYFDRIFLLFQRLHTRRKYPGSGVGLSICKKIIEYHGGTIWVESKPAQGTTFFFTIPEKAQ